MRGNLGMKIDQFQHPDSIWTWKSNARGQRATLWIPYLDCAERLGPWRWNLTYNGGDLRCCTIRPRRDLGRIPNSPSRHHGVGLWPAKLEHPVEDAAPDHGLSRLRDATPCLQAASEH